jgi:hypothetical protein
MQSIHHKMNRDVRLKEGGKTILQDRNEGFLLLELVFRTSTDSLQLNPNRQSMYCSALRESLFLLNCSSGRGLSLRWDSFHAAL